MALRRGFLQTSSLLFKNPHRNLYTGIMNTNFNPLLCIGGRLLLSGKSAKEIMTGFRNNPAEIKKHVESSSGLAGLTTKKDIAEEFSRYGGFSSNDPESYSLRQPDSAVGDVDISHLDLIHMGDFLSEHDIYGERADHESESGAVIVMPFMIKGWHVKIHNNEYHIHNPFYLPGIKENHLFKQLQASFLEVMQLKADFEFDENNPKALEAADKYIAIFIEIAGGAKEFNAKLNKLKDEIVATGYEFYSNQADFLDRALDISAKYQLPSP